MGRTRCALLLVLALSALVLWFHYLAAYQVDDAYIVYRYADNLAHGKGFVFNEGERVEGVTCFLWTLALVPFAALGLPLPIVGPILTALAGAAILLLLPGVSARLAGRAAVDGWDLATPFLLAAHPAFAYWSVGGLETVPYTLLLVLALRDLLREQERGRGRRSALWAGLATLMRPEAPLLAAALGLGRAIGGPQRENRDRVRDALAWCGLVSGFFLPFLAFRRLYFGEWLPNTYYAKTGGELLHTIMSGRDYTVRFLASLAPGFGSEAPSATAFGLLLLVLLLAVGLARPALRPAALLIYAQGIAVFIEGGDWMFLHRFWVPTLPFLALLMVGAARDLAGVSRRLRPALLGLGCLLVASGATAGVRQRDGANGLAVNAEGYRSAHHAIARYLKERGRPGDTVALMDVGIIGYESGLRVLDISGLTEPRVAKSPGGFLEKQYPAEPILAEAPRFFVLVNGYRMDERIAHHPDFLKRYRLVMMKNHRFNWTPPQSYYLYLFERRDANGGTAASAAGDTIAPAPH